MAVLQIIVNNYQLHPTTIEGCLCINVNSVQLAKTYHREQPAPGHKHVNSSDMECKLDDITYRSGRPTLMWQPVPVIILMSGTHLITPKALEAHIIHMHQSCWWSDNLNNVHPSTHRRPFNSFALRHDLRQGTSKKQAATSQEKEAIPYRTIPTSVMPGPFEPGIRQHVPANTVNRNITISPLSLSLCLFSVPYLFAQSLVNALKSQIKDAG